MDSVTVLGRRVTVRTALEADAEGPVIVLLAGMPGDIDTFLPIWDQLAAEFPVIAYDRLGEGDSDPPRGPQSLDDCSDTLEEVLGQLVPTGPLVLVGHSVGGLVAARHAHLRPDRIRSLVLLDATAPGTDREILALIPAGVTGVGALLRSEASGSATGDNPERLVFDDATVPGLGDLPLHVVVHGRSQVAAIPEYGAGIEQLLLNGQRFWASLSSRVEMTVATLSGHYIHVDQPDLVCDVVRGAARAP